MSQVKENKMGTTPIFKLLISMAIPMIISMLIMKDIVHLLNQIM